MKKTEESALKLKVTEALSKDVGRAYARMGPEDLEKLQVAIGDIVEVVGKRTTVCKAMPAYKELRGRSRMQLDGISRENAGAGIDDFVQVKKIACRPAERVVLTPITITPAERDLQYIGSLLDGLPVLEGDRIRATLFGSRTADFKVGALTPRGPVLINPTTTLVIGKAGAPETVRAAVSYEDVGGLKPQLQRIREMIELPLRYPELFERLGIDAPKGVLLHGPPGCGKTLIARTIAHETEANFFSVSGPEVVHKFYGESEAHLRKIFEEAGRKGPSIIFIDEIDSIAPRRENVVGDVEKRVVAHAPGLDGRPQQAPERHCHCRHQHPQCPGPGAPAAGAVRPGDRHPHPRPLRAPGYPGDPQPGHAPGRGRGHEPPGRDHPRFRGGRPGGPVPGSGHDLPAPPYARH